MATITYHHPDGSTRTVDATAGTSVMRAALENDVPGIVGECGGQAMCATCHVYVHDGSALHPVDDEEDEMLECTASPRDAERSRLGCQLKAGVDFEFLAVDVPDRQV